MTNSSDTPIGPSGGNQVGGSTVGSLRLAITDADLIAGTTIAFDGQHGPYTISPMTALPPIVFQTTIDGIDPKGATGNPFVTIVSNGGAFDGLVLQAGSDKSVIEGLSIEGFGGVGIDLMSGDDTIGGSTPGAGNVIFANLQGGVLIESSGNLLQRNLIEGNGVGASSNQFDGIDIRGASNTIDGNVISGNQGDGILIESSASSNLVEGNEIGTDPTGSLRVANGADGIGIQGPFNVIGGTFPGAANTISGNVHDGILITGDNATNNQVEGNLIGTNASGNGSLANADDGVEVQTPFNTIGGPVGGAINTVGATTGGDRNIISGNGIVGVMIETTATLVENNAIGTNIEGTASPSPLTQLNGVVISGPPNTLLGTTPPGMS